jgi:HAD superfamily hydrolase (TIGR01459 family)
MTEPLIYHLCRTEDWAVALTAGAYSGSSQDRRDGFIHFSTAAQVRESARRHRAGERELLLLTVDASALGGALRWEASRDGALFPHLYDDLPPAAVQSVQPLPLDGSDQHIFPVLRDDPAAEIALLSGIAAVVESYQGLILDLWGVMHDGRAPMPGVIDCLERFKSAGKRVVVLSNAPRRAHLVAERVTEIGIPRHLYDHLMSSGEETWQHLHRRDDPFYRSLGRVCYHIGPPRDDNMLADLGLTRVDDIERAEFILNTGPWGWEATVEAYEAMLQRAYARNLPMVCANPDLVVMHSGRRAICAGAIAERYEALGGHVRWHGKPLPEIYGHCFDLMGISDRRSILAVGDSLRTDIAGAAGVGIDSVWVLGGIHGEELGGASASVASSWNQTRLSQAIIAAGHRPSWAMAHLTW